MSSRDTIIKVIVQINLTTYISFSSDEYLTLYDYRVTERSQPMKPETHLKTGTSFFQNTENTDNFVDFRTEQAQFTNAINKDIVEKEKTKKELKEKQKKDVEMKMLVSKLEDLKGPPLEIPEYKDAYKVNLIFRASYFNFITRCY